MMFARISFTTAMSDLDKFKLHKTFKTASSGFDDGSVSTM